MTGPLYELFATLFPARRRRKLKRSARFSFEPMTSYELEARRMLAVTPLTPSGLVSQYSPAAIVSSFAFKAAAPTNLIVTPKDQGASLSWTAPTATGGSTINDYIVQYSIANTFNWKTIHTGGSMTRATVTNLTNGTAYVFQVAAVNSTGTGAFTSPSAPITPPGYAVVPREPLGLATKSGDGQVTVSWSAPSWDGGTPVTDYVVQYRAVNSSNWQTSSHTPSPAKTALVTGLANGASYTFRVAAVNARGTGAFSSTTVATPAAVPMAPSSLVAAAGNGTVALTWAAPASDGGSPIRDYRILSSTDGGLNWTTMTRPVSTSTQTTLSGLLNGTAYSFKIAAINLMGAGSYSNTVGPVTPAATVPAAPTSIVTSIGDHSIGLRWLAPADDGGSAVAGYTVQYSADGGNSWQSGSVSPVQGTNTAVTNLTNGTPYIFRVAAINAVGRGSFSVPTTPLAPATVPGQSGNIGVTAANSAAVLNWSAPLIDGGSPVNDYAIQFSTNAGASWNFFPHTPSIATSLTVTGLTNGVEYVFRVAAVNVIGAGAYSPTSSSVFPVAPASTPSAPTSLSVQAGNGQATLAWSEPSSNGNSVIKGYEISYSSDGRTSWSPPLSLPATSRTATVTGLLNSVAYVFRVVAVNAVGKGSEAAVSATPTNPAAQAAVQFLKYGTLPVTVQFSYTVRDANGNQQPRFLHVDIGSTQQIGSITVPDFDRVQSTVTVTVTVRNLPRGITKTESFTLQKKTNYYMNISYNTQATDPWSATTIRCI